jgi:hypothetical protein
VVQIDEVPSFRGIRFDPEIGIFADEERLREAAKNADSLADIINNLGLRASGCRYAQLRAALVKFGIRQPVWEGKALGLILDHENGDPSDHRLENLRFVCPNCESQLPTHGSRNRKKAAA